MILLYNRVNNLIHLLHLVSLVTEYNIFDSEYGVLVAVGIALAAGFLLGLCCCVFFACVCFRMKTVHKKKQCVHIRSPTFSDDKTIALTDLM